MELVGNHVETVDGEEEKRRARADIILGCKEQIEGLECNLEMMRVLSCSHSEIR